MIEWRDVRNGALAVTVVLWLGGCAATGPERPTGVAPQPDVPSSVAQPTGDIGQEIASLERSSCSQGSLGENLDAVASSIESQKLLYDTKPGTDCSGIFHRVVESLSGRCPGSPVPPPEARDTRSLARWYAEQNRLVWIESPLERDDLIRPGAVLFFGQGGRRYSSAELGHDLMYETGQGIDHMGIVTKVEMKDGRVEQYWMLHGHGKKGRTAAGVTTTQYSDHNGSTKYNNQNRNYISRREGRMPAYGNWNQHWVAVAPVLEPSRRAGIVAEDEALANLGEEAPLYEGRASVRGLITLSVD